MEWIKCSEQMPPRFSVVLITNGKFLAIAEYGKYEWDVGEDELGYDFDFVTHWMPLPDLP